MCKWWVSGFFRKSLQITFITSAFATMSVKPEPNVTVPAGDAAKGAKVHFAFIDLSLFFVFADSGVFRSSRSNALSATSSILRARLCRALIFTA
jgi:hypothetical protein